MSVNLRSLGNDVLGEIFSYLDLPSLVKCERVCKYWLERARDPRFYHFFVKKNQFFYRNDQSTYFADEVRKKFIEHYSLIKDYKDKDLSKEWNSMLPDFFSFNNPVANRNTAPFSKFDYLGNRSKILAFLHLGAMKFEIDPGVNRPLSLAAYKGDDDMVTKILTVFNKSVPTTNILFHAAVMAALNKHGEIVKILHESNKEIFGEMLIIGITLNQYITLLTSGHYDD